MKHLFIITILVCATGLVRGQNELDPFDLFPKPFKENNKYGYKNENGVVIIQPKFDFADGFQWSLANVSLNNNVALIDQTGKLIIQFGIYDIIYSFREGMARVSKAKKYGFIDKTGKEIISCSFDEADFFRNGLSSVKKNNKEGIINTSGEEVIPIQYEKIIQMQSFNLIKIKLDGKWGFIDYKGDIFIKPEFDQVDQPWFGMIMVKKDGKYGYVNNSGVLVIPCKYEQANPFTESGKAFVILDGKKGVVSKDGTEKFLK